MKKLFALLLTAVLLASCAQEQAADCSSLAESLVSRNAFSAESTHSIDPYADLNEEETAVRRVSDAAIFAKYGEIDLQNYQIDISERVDGGKVVKYALVLFGYRTGESYLVRIGSDGTEESVWGEYGEYARYLDTVTEQAFRDAEARLQEQLKSYDDSSSGYLSVDEEGWLCLNAEVIVEGVQGCCGDHDHRFFSERICR